MKNKFALYFGVTSGNDLLCAAILRELNKRGIRNVWMFPKYPEFFNGYPDAVVVKKIDPWLMDYALLISITASNMAKAELTAYFCSHFAFDFADSNR